MSILAVMPYQKQKEQAMDFANTPHHMDCNLL